MAIKDKPFSFDEMLRRTIFKGRPNFFNAKDFNKELLTIHSFIEEFNRVFGVWSDIKFSILSFSDVFNENSNDWKRSINLNWTEGSVLYKGIKYNIEAGGINGYLQEYPNPNDSVSPKEVKPPTYVVLVGKLKTVTYADNPTLCGIQSDETPSTVPTVDVEQWQDIEVRITPNPIDIELESSEKVICVLATIHPRYTKTGEDNGYGFLYNTFNNTTFTMKNGSVNTDSVFESNQSLYEYLVERVVTRLDEVINERQLVRRFNLADLENAENARYNLGLSNVVNYKQLVQDENLRDLTDLTLARHNLGLGSSATRDIGYGESDVAPGNIVPLKCLVMWSGSPSDIPTGWALCDGSNNTPDMRGKFAVGFDPSITEFNSLGKFGGSTEASIGLGNLPKHNHKGTTDIEPAHSHGFNDDQAGSDVGVGFLASGSEQRNQDLSGAFTAEAGEHSHPFTTEFGGGVDNPEPIKIVPPYYTICYIQYIGTTIKESIAPDMPPPLTYPNYSEPTKGTDGGYSDYTPITIGGNDGKGVGSGVVLTNPE